MNRDRAAGSAGARGGLGPLWGGLELGGGRGGCGVVAGKLGAGGEGVLRVARMV